MAVAVAAVIDEVVSVIVVVHVSVEPIRHLRHGAQPLQHGSNRSRFACPDATVVAGWRRRLAISIGRLGPCGVAASGSIREFTLFAR